jgi:hypothetical protein
VRFEIKRISAEVRYVKEGVSRYDAMLARLLFIVVLSLSGCYKPEPCRNEIGSTAPSPNGKLKAVVFKRVCPYEQTVSSEISILRATEGLPDGNGNIFAYSEYTPIRVAWVRDDRLAVYTYGNLSKATKIEKMGNITVEYSEIMETDLVRPNPEAKGQ